MTKILPAHSEQNPHPTEVIREMRYMVQNAMAFQTPIASLFISLLLSLCYILKAGTNCAFTQTGFSGLKSCLST